MAFRRNQPGERFNRHSDRCVYNLRIMTPTEVVTAINAGGEEFCVSSIEDARLSMLVWNDTNSESVSFTFGEVEYISLPPAFEGVLSIAPPEMATELRRQHALSSDSQIFIFSSRSPVPTEGRAIQHHDGNLVYGKWVVRVAGWVSAHSLTVDGAAIPAQTP